MYRFVCVCIYIYLCIICMCVCAYKFTKPLCMSRIRCKFSFLSEINRFEFRILLFLD